LASDAEIDSALAAHRARNTELRQLLLTKNVVLSEERPVDVHFWADDRHDAATLARGLFKKGFLVTLLAPSSENATGAGWNVEAGALIAPDQILGERLTEQLVRMAAECNATYDGWGTQI
jgi:regulator of RNase E activity RraB